MGNVKFVKSTKDDWRKGFILASGKHCLWRNPQTGDIDLIDGDDGSVSFFDHNHWVESPNALGHNGQRVEFISELVYVGETDLLDEAIQIVKDFEQNRRDKVMKQYHDNQDRIVKEAYEKEYGNA